MNLASIAGKRQGISFLEMLISSALFLLALGLCGQLAMAGIHTRQRNTERNGAFRQTVTLFHQLQRDLQDCEQVYQPDLNDLAPHLPGQNEPPLALRVTRADGTPLVVSWKVAEETLCRTLYRPDFNPLVVASQVPLAGEFPDKSSGVERFLVQLEPPGQHFGSRLLRLELDCAKPAAQKLISTIELPR